MKKLLLFTIAIATSAHAAVYTTDFRSGNTVQAVFTSGTFTATIAYTGSPLSVYGTTDPTLLTQNNGTVTLTLSEPVSSITFDFGGIDSGDSATFTSAPTVSAPINTESFYQAGLPQLVGTTVSMNVTNGEGARLAFTGLDNVTSFSWQNVGIWTFYDNFSFVTSVPEPGICGLLSLGGVALAFRRCRRAHKLSDD